MSFVVFSQTLRDRLDEAALVATARAHFGANLTVERASADEPPPSGPPSLVILLTPRGHPRATRFELVWRSATAADHQAARQAEQAGHATGMGTLAARCPVVVLVQPIDASTSHEEVALHTLCGVLAATLLGPVMPPDRSTLYGVRGARERADRADSIARG